MADPLLLPGATHPAVETLRALLAEQMPEARFSVAVPQVYDSQLVQLVHEYQKRKGLVVDGKVGPNTWAALRGTSIVFTEDEVIVASPPATVAKNDNTKFILFGAAAVMAWYLWG